MQEFMEPTTAQIQEYLLRLYFGSQGACLEACISRAYADLSRTVRGIAKHPSGGKARNDAASIIDNAIRTCSSFLKSQPAFDEWHRAACERVIANYHHYNFPSFTVGQAQKWVNMSVKYAAVIGQRATVQGSSIFVRGHVPIDSIMLDALEPYGLRTERFRPWSRIQSYETYMEFQEWIRSKFPHSVPLAVEFHLWMQSATRS